MKLTPISVEEDDKGTQEPNFKNILNIQQITCQKYYFIWQNLSRFGGNHGNNRSQCFSEMYTILELQYKSKSV